ncbi:10755_t:CDS:2, partial [Dentiscutata erythropus]
MAEHLIPHPPSYIPPPACNITLNNLQSEYEYARKNWVTHTLTHKLLDNVTLDALQSKHKKRDFNVTFDIFHDPTVWTALVQIGTLAQGVALLYDLENKSSYVESTKYLINVNDFNLNQSYTFGMVDNLDYLLAEDFTITGVFGLGYEKDCDSTKCTTFNSFLKSKEFIQNGGLVIFGGYLSSMAISNIIWLPLVDQGAAAGFLISGRHFSVYESFPAVLSNSNDRIVFSVEFANKLTEL